MKIMKYQINLESKNQKVAQNFYLFYKGERVAIEPSDIIYLEADINYTKFFMQSKKLTSSFTLKFFNDLLKNNPSFLRINRGLLINVNYLESIDWNKSIKEVRLKDGVVLPISRRREEFVREIVCGHNF